MNDHNHDLHGPDAGPLPGEPGNPNPSSHDQTPGEVPPEPSKEEPFNLAQFLPDAGALLVMPVIKSGSSDNIYTCVASKGESKVGVSITLTAHAKSDKGYLSLTTRILELPNSDGHSSFANPGEDRTYSMDGMPVKVYMLRKEVMPLCDIRVSPWEVSYHLDSGIRAQLTAWVSETLTSSGCAIDCKDDQQLEDVLFSRLNQIADTPAVLWKTLEGLTPKTL